MSAVLASNRPPRAPILACAALVALAASPPAEAFGPQARMRMVRDAVKLMPRSLRELLERHEKDVLRGALEPLAREDDPEHLPPAAGGTLPRAIVEASDAVTAAVDRRAPFREVAERFGNLAHYVADAAFPPNAAGADGEGHYRHFAALLDDRLAKIPFVFYGHEDPDLARDDREAFARRLIASARSEDAELRRAYAAAGDPPSPEAFDDRSVPFAIAALSYQHAATDVVRAWIDAWARAHGDLGRTPYMKRRPARPAPADR